MNKKDAIIETLEYFSYFKYLPKPEELLTYLPYRTTKKELTSILSSITFYPNKTYKKITTQRKEVSKRKLERIQFLLKILSHVSYLKFIGLSGSMGMMNADENDDIDICIITAKKRIWTSRMIVLTILSMFGKRRKRTDVNFKNKICANLWFDESNLELPEFKRNLYTAHEIVQLRPIINKDSTYERFLQANKWINKYFPNYNDNYTNELSKLSRKSFWQAKLRLTRRSASRISWDSGVVRNIKQTPQNDEMNLISNFIENILKYIQLTIINRHRTSEIITDTQLWFFPDDFEKKLRKEGIL